MAPRHLLGTSPDISAESRRGSGPPRTISARRAHLLPMETRHTHTDAIGNVLSTSELAAYLQVSVQTLYDLRSQGRGPRGFRVGRELRFRLCEIESWLERMERADEERHRLPESAS